MSLAIAVSSGVRHASGSLAADATVRGLQDSPVRIPDPRLVMRARRPASRLQESPLMRTALRS